MRKRSPDSLAIRGWVFAIAWILASTGSAGLLLAQLGPPNESGVSIGHVHLTVRSPEAHKKLWVDMLGAQVTHSGSLELLRLPGLFIVLEEGEPSAGSAGSSVNHIGLWIKDHADVEAKVTAASLEISSNNYDALKCAAAPATPACQMIVVFPDGVRVEFTEDKTLSTTSASHHIHTQTTDPESLRAWYATMFGATAGFRRNTIMAALFEGGEVDFSRAPEARAPTKGRAIDHIGFEVRGLEEFCGKLEAQGVEFETPCDVAPGTGLKSGFIMDPAGTRIELTEGLATP